MPNETERKQIEAGDNNRWQDSCRFRGPMQSVLLRKRPKKRRARRKKSSGPTLFFFTLSHMNGLVLSRAEGF